MTSRQGAQSAAGAQKCPVRAVASCALPRLQKEIEVLEDTGPLTTVAGERPAALSPAKDQKAEVVLDSQQVRG